MTRNGVENYRFIGKRHFKVISSRRRQTNEAEDESGVITFWFLKMQHILEPQLPSEKSDLSACKIKYTALVTRFSAGCQQHIYLEVY